MRLEMLSNHPSVRWARLSIFVGGLLMIALWLVFTSVHGPTSYNLDDPILGRGMLFWGRLLGGLPTLLVGLGLIMLYTFLVGHANRLARVGYALTLLGLFIPALLDLWVFRALGPPLFVPVLGIGLLLLARGSAHNPALSRSDHSLLMFIGICQVIAFFLALIPLDVTDQVGGYRIYGFFAHFLTGIGWMAFAISLWKMKTTATSSL